MQDNGNNTWFGSSAIMREMVFCFLVLMMMMMMMIGSSKSIHLIETENCVPTWQHSIMNVSAAISHGFDGNEKWNKKQPIVFEIPLITWINVCVCVSISCVKGSFDFWCSKTPNTKMDMEWEKLVPPIYHGKTIELWSIAQTPVRRIAQFECSSIWFL